MSHLFYVESDIWDSFGTLRHAHIDRRDSFGRYPVILVQSGPDGLGGIDLISASNMSVLSEAFDGDETVKLSTGPYCDVFYARVDESGEPLSETVAEYVRALEDYPLLDESDHSEREAAYLAENLPEWLWWEIFRTGSDAAKAWIDEADYSELASVFAKWLDETGADYPHISDDIEVPDIEAFVSHVGTL